MQANRLSHNNSMQTNDRFTTVADAERYANIIVMIEYES